MTWVERSIHHETMSISKTSELGMEEGFEPKQNRHNTWTQGNQHSSFVSYLGEGLLDRIPGHSKFFPEDSSQAIKYPMPHFNRFMGPPPTIKVQAQGNRYRTSLRGWKSADTVQEGTRYNVGVNDTACPPSLAEICVNPFPAGCTFPSLFPAVPVFKTAPQKRDCQQVYSAKYLPFLEDEDLHSGLVQDKSCEGGEIVFLSERQDLLPSKHVDRAQSWRRYGPADQSLESENDGELVTQRMNATVGLLLQAASVLEGNEVHVVICETTESTADSIVVDREKSPATPTSLSPLHTLANLSAERLSIEVSREQSKRHNFRAPTSRLQAASVWIRGGHRASNKEQLTRKPRRKPYDRPERLPSLSDTTMSSGEPDWYTDFREFERQAIARKRSDSVRTSILSGAGSLSNMPPVGRKVMCAGNETVAKGSRKAKSLSTEGVRTGMHVVKPTETVKGRPLSASPVKRGRGRPRKADVQARQVAKINEKKVTSRLKAEPEMEIKTRFGRVVKKVVKASYD